MRGTWILLMSPSTFLKNVLFLDCPTQLFLNKNLTDIQTSSSYDEVERYMNTPPPPTHTQIDIGQQTFSDTGHLGNNHPWEKEQEWGIPYKSPNLLLGEFLGCDVEKGYSNRNKQSLVRRSRVQSLWRQTSLKFSERLL